MTAVALVLILAPASAEAVTHQDARNAANSWTHEQCRLGNLNCGLSLPRSSACHEGVRDSGYWNCVVRSSPREVSPDTPYITYVYGLELQFSPDDHGRLVLRSQSRKWKETVDYRTHYSNVEFVE